MLCRAPFAPFARLWLVAPGVGVQIAHGSRVPVECTLVHPALGSIGSLSLFLHIVSNLPASLVLVHLKGPCQLGILNQSLFLEDAEPLS